MEVGVRLTRFAAVTVLLTTAATGICTGVVNADPAVSNARNVEATDYEPTGQVIADSGLRPRPDGFSFENYATSGNPVNLTLQSMYQIFGNTVCGYASGGTCTLSPQAQRWMTKQNRDMAGGHCYGMSATSLLMYRKRLLPSDFQKGANTTWDLRFENPSLQEMIARQMVGQFLKPVTDGKKYGSPNQIINYLANSLKPGATESYTLMFAKRNLTAGHAITPFALEDRGVVDGDRMIAIMVYDNNYRGEIRQMVVNTAKNSWTYETASDPTRPSAPYEGDATTGTLQLAPLSPAQGQQQFPYAGRYVRGVNAAPAGAAPVTVSLQGDLINHGNLMLTDDQGRSTGFSGDKRVNDIPGAEFVDTMADDSAYRIAPDIQVPAGTHMTITVDGAGLEKADPTEVTIINSASEIAVSGINLGPQSKSTIDVSADGTSVTYASTDEQAPTIEIGEDYETDGYTFIAKDAAVGAGGSITVSLPANDEIYTVDASKSGKTESVDIEMRRDGKNGEQKLTHDGLAMAAGGTATFDYEKWDKDDTAVQVTISENGTTRNEELTPR
ncbi:hypothetical protein [Nocardia sp. NPDC051570]|uniref:hypothetical protein n=1 Tax=Nocardia sp. NPDC051570 TaxID=3364324 RepID=UPI0037B4AD4F